MTATTEKESAFELACAFHETYERLAPSFGYETRTETRLFNPDSSNGKLMIAVCAELLNKMRRGPMGRCSAEDAKADAATTSTDTERAEFIQWRMDDGKTDEMRAAHEWDNDHLVAQSWQAARRAPVVQQGWRVVPTVANEKMQRAIAAQFNGTAREAIGVWSEALAAAPQPPEAAPHVAQDKMQANMMKMCMPLGAAAHQPPEANHSGDAAGMVGAPVQLPEPVAKIFFDRKECHLRELPAWEKLRPYGEHDLVSLQQVSHLLAEHEQALQFLAGLHQCPTIDGPPAAAALVKANFAHELRIYGLQAA